ncbi:hypothetical protein ACE1TI_19265 [Alteribacillus sp. JSM 102045]|uniref:hypothetical protein n=1 Tax=Alteribacillus sp. JSM 102045 TaxID=1562101 RepID=UPI0035C26BAD
MSKVNISIKGDNRIAQSMNSIWDGVCGVNVSWNEEESLKKANLIIETVNFDRK